MTHRQACNALFELVGDGDRQATAILDEASRYIAYGCVTICNMFNPERIILGDIVSGAGQRLLDIVRDITSRRVSAEVIEATDIRLSQLPADATVAGAAAVAITQFLTTSSRFFDIS